MVRVRVIRERLSATPGHVIGQGPAPGGGVVPCGGGGGRGRGRGECTFLRYYELFLKTDFFGQKNDMFGQKTDMFGQQKRHVWSKN